MKTKDIVFRVFQIVRRNGKAEEVELKLDPNDMHFGSHYCGPFRKGDRLILSLSFAKEVRERLLPLNSAGREVVSRLLEGNNQNEVRQRFTVFETENHVPFVRSRNGTITLIQLMEEGWFKLWRVSIVSQDGQFFMVVDDDETARCYYDDEGCLACPQYEDGWPAFMEWLDRWADANPNNPWLLNLPCFTAQLRKNTSRKAQATPSLKLDRNEAEVAWFNPITGVAMLWISSEAARLSKLDTQEVRCNIMHMERPLTGRFKRLRAGQLVRYDKVVPINKTNAVVRYPTTFAAELRGVRAC